MRLSICFVTISLFLFGCEVGSSKNKPHQKITENYIQANNINKKTIQVSQKKCVNVKVKYEYCIYSEIKMDAFEDKKINEFLLYYFLEKKVFFGNLQYVLSDIVNSDIEQSSNELSYIFSDDMYPFLPSEGYYTRHEIQLISSLPQLLYFGELYTIHTGEPHPNSYKNIVMDRANYHPVKLQEILLPEVEEKLVKLQRDYIVKELMINEVEVNSDKDPLKRLKNIKKMIKGINPKLNDNWGFYAKHIIFTYSPYDPFTFDLGIINVKIPFKRLKGIIKPEYLKKLERMRLK